VDARAFAELVARHHARVYNLMLRMAGSPVEAADLTQEAFLRAWRARDAYDPQRPALPWLYRIAVNALRDQARSRRRHPEVLGDPEPAGSAPSPEDDAVTREGSARLWAAVAALPPTYRLPILLYYQHEMDVAGVAAVLGLPATIVKNRLFRARRALRQALSASEEGGAPWTRSHAPATPPGR
jgi:RNA polymerase sigma factor (sigma-70 family)